MIRNRKGEPGKGLVFPNHGHSDIEGFSGADWVCQPSDTHAPLLDILFSLAEILSRRKVRKLFVPDRAPYLKYRAMGNVTSELLWLHIHTTYIN